MTLTGKSITEINGLLSGKKVKPEEVFTHFTKRVKKYNPGLNAFLTVLDSASPGGIERNTVVSGVPFSLKDTYSTKGIKTTASSKVLEYYVPQYDAAVFRKLKEAGAALLGKTNCDAWGHGSSTENSDFGPTKNPWNTEYVPGGSSGGSAAAVAAGLSVFDIGEDTGGSIRLPASFCGVVGLKVTYGLVSRYGCIAYASSLDTVGPITRSVRDTALVLDIIAGNDPFDATSSNHEITNYRLKLKEKRVFKIGIPDEYFAQGVDPEVAQKVDDAVSVFKKLGAQIVKISLPMTKYAIAAYYLIATSETSSNLARYDGIRYGRDRSYFGEEAKRRIMLGSFTLSAGYYDQYYKRATKVRTLIMKDFERAFEKVDVIIAPTSPTPPFKFGEKIADPLQMYMSDILTVPVNLAGIPAISIPCGLTKSALPVGLQIIGKQFDEATLLNLAYQFEKETNFFNVREEVLKKYPD